MTPRPAETFSVPVAGGALHVARWDGDGDAPVVVAAHGITATHMEWPAVAEALGGDVTLVAPDLRGRGRSNALPGPYGMAAHADDMAAVLDAVGVERAVVVGHSMGAYVAVVMAARFPARVSGLVLVDGGLPLPVPAGLSVDEILDAVIGPAMARLSMCFESREAYREFWRAHPAFKEWTPEVQAYVDYDLVGQEPELRSSASADAVRGDAQDTLVAADRIVDALDRLPCPAVLLRAPRGMFDQEGGLLPDDVVQEWRHRQPLLADVLVPGVNHYTITISRHGAATVADAIRKAVSQA